MRKIVLYVLTLLVSAHVVAANSDLGSAISKSINKQNNSVGQTPPSMIYGGKDFSHQVIATANESVWAKKHTLLVG